MSRKIACTISSVANTYEIIIQNQISIAHYLTSFDTQFAIVTDDRVGALYGNQLQQALFRVGKKAYVFTFPNGEPNKTRKTKEFLEDQFFAKGLGKDTCMIALGGGVTTDIGGYLAATYCRGIPLVMIPTSLLGMIDASIGGKTGVNLQIGKNMLGCIYQPKKILIDPFFLKTLPLSELRNGIVEMIKYGLIADSNFFDYLEKHVDQIFALDSQVMERVIATSCNIKKAIVQLDEKEKGQRRILNFGHTIGHALESLTNYSISHGEAVAIGILVESYLSMCLGHIDTNIYNKIRNIFAKFAIPIKLPRFPIQQLIDHMILDKKSIKGVPRFVIISKIGAVLDFEGAYCTHVKEDLLKKILQWMNDDLCSH